MPPGSQVRVTFWCGCLLGLIRVDGGFAPLYFASCSMRCPTRAAFLARIRALRAQDKGSASS